MNTAKKAAFVLSATGLALGAAAGSAFAHGGDADGLATNSGGIGSGNVVQAPVNVPVNATGNTGNVVGLLNPSFGNGSANQGSGGGAMGATENSPGVVSGNQVQAPVNVPTNVVGNSVTAVGGLNPTFGNDGVNR
ncbi:Syd protein [Streptomyces sp. NBRC 110611]|uniref:chaplin n=1 Tax=Streptomyces sp. NBRC 110611 TaxID=1621259 RepID=UPI0008377A14|nr:Syd protein [Streptomyces sp. NBRC 110611]